MGFPRFVFWDSCCFIYIYIYINDFPNIILKLSHSLLFADDSSVLVTSTNYVELNQKLNSTLHHVSKWFQTSKLVLNANITYIGKFTPSKATFYPFNRTHAAQILAVVETTKFLFSHLDSHLSWQSNINVLLQKLRSVYFMMRILSYVLNIDTLRIAYFAHFQSPINYHIIFFWGGLINNHAQYIFNTKKNTNYAGTRSYEIL